MHGPRGASSDPFFVNKARLAFRGELLASQSYDSVSRPMKIREAYQLSGCNSGAGMKGGENVNADTGKRGTGLEEYMRRFLERLPDPVHRRLIQAYGGEDPVASMEVELGNVLREVVNSED